MVGETLVVAFSEVPWDHFMKRLENLPGQIQAGGIWLVEYGNGSLQRADSVRDGRYMYTEDSSTAKLLPCPEGIALGPPAAEDTTDYLQRDGRFYPGTTLCSIANVSRKPDRNRRWRERFRTGLPKKGDIESTASAGILLGKDGQQRLACSYHNWQSQDEAQPGIIGRNDQQARKVLQVVQGKTTHNKPRTRVG
ncbi:hypothetical protein Dda_8632 [Drechslerella dactyloides]|uniref:Uncharacterized protein n=1 Tax=Drechslerella dactyloides TaxID=74499 RepID=A0AAD6NFU2_DREDA|nr:hypothetical protein Dda_8632 [Drechslerella dactyloides]